MKLIIELEMDNAAFADEPQHEPARILSHVAIVIANGNLGMEPDANMPLRDINGNKVGHARVEA